MSLSDDWRRATRVIVFGIGLDKDLNSTSRDRDTFHQVILKMLVSLRRMVVAFFARALCSDLMAAFQKRSIICATAVSRIMN